MSMRRLIRIKKIPKGDSHYYFRVLLLRWCWISGPFRTRKVMWSDIKSFCRRWAFRLTPWPVYFSYWSRDCDLMEVTCPVRFANGWIAWEEIWKSRAESEGPECWERLSRREYLNFCEEGASYWDRSAERMNY